MGAKESKIKEKLQKIKKAPVKNAERSGIVNSLLALGALTVAAGVLSHEARALTPSCNAQGDVTQSDNPALSSKDLGADTSRWNNHHWCWTWSWGWGAGT